MGRYTFEEIQKREERKKRWRSLHEQGFTYQDIAKMEGVSRQRVYQVIGGERGYFRGITKEECVYDGVRDWMNENKISKAKFIRKIYGYYACYLMPKLSNVLKGANTRKNMIDNILTATGLTYEEAFKRSDE